MRGRALTTVLSLIWLLTLLPVIAAAQDEPKLRDYAGLSWMEVSCLKRGLSLSDVQVTSISRDHDSTLEIDYAGMRASQQARRLGQLSFRPPASYQERRLANDKAIWQTLTATQRANWPTLREKMAAVGLLGIPTELYGEGDLSDEQVNKLVVLQSQLNANTAARVKAEGASPAVVKKDELQKLADAARDELTDAQKERIAAIRRERAQRFRAHGVNMPDP